MSDLPTEQPQRPWPSYRRHHPTEAAALDAACDAWEAEHPVNDVALDVEPPMNEPHPSFDIDEGENTLPVGFKPWQPGQSGNPGGRPGGTLGFAKAIQRATMNGEKLWKIALGIAENERAHNRDRLDAVAWLADRGFGKALDISSMLSEDDVDRIARVNGVDPERIRAHIKQINAAK